MNRLTAVDWEFPGPPFWTFIALVVMELLGPCPMVSSATATATCAFEVPSALAGWQKLPSCAGSQSEAKGVRPEPQVPVKSAQAMPEAPAASPTTRFYPEAVELGRPFRWEIEMIVPTGTLVTFPELNFDGTGLESEGHVDLWDEPLPGDSSHRRWRRTWELMLWELKDVRTPELVIETRTGETRGVIPVPSQLIPRQATRIEDWETRVPLPAAQVWDEAAASPLPAWQWPGWSIAAAWAGAALAAASLIWFWRLRRGERPSRSAFEQADRQLRLWEQSLRSQTDNTPGTITALRDLIRQYLAARTATDFVTSPAADEGAIPVARTWEEWEQYGLGDEDLIRATTSTWGPLTARLEELRYSGAVVTSEQWLLVLGQARRWLQQFEQELRVRESVTARSSARRERDRSCGDGVR